jgi:sigma-B regulation protein RsbU (phosphoserine phosphatase)
MKTILVVEDDLAISRGLCYNLEREGYRVLSEKDGMRGYERAKTDHPDLVILDVMLPGMDGFRICSALKKEGFGSPIFLLTGLTQERSRLEGLWQGADDYIEKPFSLQELMLRIRNALRQRDALQGKAKILEDEFLKARKIQMASLPRQQPHVQGFDVFGKTIPATEVGGDYFDYLKLSQRRFGVLVADVSGKGMPAAMYVQKMQGIVQSSKKNLKEASDVLLVIQEHMHEAMDASSFITAVAAVFDSDEQCVETAQAGHLPVLHVRKKKVRLLKPPGVWIGRTSSDLFGKNLRSEKIEIRKGDVFLFYSDGLIEAKNEQGREFGLSRLKKLACTTNANIRALIERCFGEVRKYSGNQPQSDDITIVGIKVLTDQKKKVREAR